MSHPLVVAVTGASGAIYGLRLLSLLLQNGLPVHLTISPSGAQVIKQELGRTIDLDNFSISDLLPGEIKGQFTYHQYTDFMTPIASGSFKTSAMVVVPCSGSTVAAIAAGTSNNLIHRAADVHLKEGRKLILVTRESPLSLIHLDNMKKAAVAGATILPASPGWYHGVRTIDDLVDFVVGRILDQIGLDNGLIQRWGEPAQQENASSAVGSENGGAVSTSQDSASTPSDSSQTTGDSKS